MGRWSLFPPLFLVLVLSLSLGCGMLGFGGDSEDDGPMGLIQFDDADPVDEPGAGGAAVDGVDEGALVSPVSINPEVLVEIHFLYSFQVRMEGLRQVIRDLNAGLEHSGPADVDLDWVIEVHQVTPGVGQVLPASHVHEGAEVSAGPVRASPDWDVGDNPGRWLWR